MKKRESKDLPGMMEQKTPDWLTNSQRMAFAAVPTEFLMSRQDWLNQLDTRRN